MRCDIIYLETWETGKLEIEKAGSGSCQWKNGKLDNEMALSLLGELEKWNI